MEIKILGTGCPNCKTLYATVEKAITELGLKNITLTKEEDILKIMEYNVLGLPALIKDEKVLSTGKVLSLEEVKQILTK